MLFMIWLEECNLGTQSIDDIMASFLTEDIWHVFALILLCAYKAWCFFPQTAYKNIVIFGNAKKYDFAFARVSTKYYNKEKFVTVFHMIEKILSFIQSRLLIPLFKMEAWENEGDKFSVFQSQLTFYLVLGFPESSIYTLGFSSTYMIWYLYIVWLQGLLIWKFFEFNQSTTNRKDNFLQSLNHI